MIVVVNEQQVEVDEQITVAALLASLGFPAGGIAVAVDFSVLPRSDWATKVSELPALSGRSEPVRLEVVTAVQGG
ncbi:sulfur carrier protein ThiS [Mycobacterium haemophilum]|uniref:Thiamine biosynthesis protein ThiS n=1 Tax=Mycobacterium haemophilum TaxID=29311 RepID=A0A0I9V3M8_9MYCO|nr:sulfur carrier protein ThiS [Mycobacterium haemophilum]AKN15344.1 thiamine biosynthesis protein ThiS [Mycobacterium haemophilum DSM 44634]KLO33182.1 thiamine biosynthesis protein ThiS [Mycobacterium haemophilum]KLO38138.1 thiamine biosynthesis protein ThiS [Mycobacterium haemophilum]KLO44460.1 thiamine biosynthesis protein ThiS [Mycobacterium haemophilum]KLO49528.1 thiamine biosynthesis protein ThiS [Mycobacterium haemophilum]